MSEVDPWTAGPTAPTWAIVMRCVLARAPLAMGMLAGFVSACTPSSTTGGAPSAESAVPSAPACASASNAALQAQPTSCVIPPRADEPAESKTSSSVDGAPLAICSTAPMTGVYRDGRCATGPDDVGVHVVCAKVTEEFLRFTVARGNDLVTPARGFPGLRAGDRWCLCAARWAEAEAAGVAPPVVLEATEARALRTIPRRYLDARALHGTKL